ncbi:hypothetical protein PLANPX_1700 [Lacipirellula parvula]|uniref:Uncharacterized protein n=1 Tax=Lacipirellula parvula TaxID=2650471 RepID=A0A5K7X6D0_9BACT|nr:hypothetical protein PLANPX_1700 [Lacipirellula parvula]
MRKRAHEGALLSNGVVAASAVAVKQLTASQTFATNAYGCAVGDWSGHFCAETGADGESPPAK